MGNSRAGRPCARKTPLAPQDERKDSFVRTRVRLLADLTKASRLGLCCTSRFPRSSGQVRCFARSTTWKPLGIEGVSRRKPIRPVRGQPGSAALSRLCWATRWRRIGEAGANSNPAGPLWVRKEQRHGNHLAHQDKKVTYFSYFDGGRTRARTLDPLIKSQLLYQLSYAPIAPRDMPPGRPRPVAKARRAGKRKRAIRFPPARGPLAASGRLSSSPCRPACSCRSRASWRAISLRPPRSDGRWRARASP